jgi:hypothetical protein
VVGHADFDAARESRQPGFHQLMSEKRAAAVSFELCSQLGLSMSATMNWLDIGFAARSPVVAGPKTEAERICNRRVEVTLVRSPQMTPALDQNQHLAVEARWSTFLEYYELALQGTSGQLSPPRAEQFARDIAFRVLDYFPKSGLETKNGCEKYPGFRTDFKTAIQGTASKYPTADLVVSNAAEIAQHAYFGRQRGHRTWEWKNATLPQAMALDCEVVRGQVAGPENHVLCGTHGHVVDTNAKTVIAHDLDEYKRLFRK